MTKLGITDRQPRWSEEDLSFLNDHYGLLSDEEICRRLKRSRNGIVIAAKRHLHITRKMNFYTAREVAQQTGIGCAKTIVFWKQKHWLKGKRSPVKEGLNRRGLFLEEDIEACLRKRPWLANRKKMPEHWFRSVVLELFGTGRDIN